MWPNPLETADLVTITEEILNDKLHFLCNVAAAQFLSTEKPEGLRYDAAEIKMFMMSLNRKFHHKVSEGLRQPLKSEIFIFHKF